MLTTRFGYSQDIILKPDENITPFYTLEEWIYSNSNWGFDSYDFKNIQAFTPYFSSELEEAPALFINGERYLTSWLTNGTFNFPEISFSQIDSIIVKPYQKVTNGNYTPNGSIHIFLKDLKNGVLYDAIYVNQINDPGPNIATEYESNNVEVLSKKKYHVLSIKDFLNTTLLYNVEYYTRTNTLDYNRKFTPSLFGRTIIRLPSGGSVLQRNRELAFILKNTIENSNYKLNLTSSFTTKSQHYEWHPISGIEVPASHRTFQIASNFRTRKDSFYKSTQLNYSFSDSDSLEFADASKPKNYVIEQQLHHTSAFGFDYKSDQISIYINNILYSWEDEITENSNSLFNHSLTFNYLSEKLGSINLFVGNHTIGLDFKKPLSNNLNIDLSTFRSNLNSSGYNYTFWNEGIGFSNLDPSIHSVTNSSSFTNIYSTAKLSSSINKNNVKLTWNVYPVHYWNFVNTNINYELISGLQQLGSEITYTDEKNVGFIRYYSALSMSPIPKVNLRTTISGRFLSYGNNKYLENVEGINNLIFTQILSYKADRNLVYELLYKYISPRRIHEYESLEDISNFYISRVRPIKLLNASVKTWLIDRSLLVTLSLRNLLNSTESYNTNGQYYNMSIHFSAILHIGKK